MDNPTADDLRNGLAGAYVERTELIKTLLTVASALEGPAFLREYRITNAIRKQMASIRRMDLHLNRMRRRLKKCADDCL